MKTPMNAAVEWPTLLLIVACYAAWALATTVLSALWLPLGMAVAILTIALHSSLQHEALHCHPFRVPMLNEVLVALPVGLAFPYRRFRDTHLQHHHDERLTDPYDDPESNYMDPEVWARLSSPLRLVLRFNNTLVGRILIGPFVSVISFVRGDLRAIRAGDRRILADWLLHGLGILVLAPWFMAMAMPFWAYLLCAYGGMGILKIRTFLEHRAHELARGRTVLVEGGRVLPFLFLNNNLHVVHHAKPGVPWYRLPEIYRANREAYLRRNEGYMYSSYGEVFRRYFFRAKDPVPHPIWHKS